MEYLSWKTQRTFTRRIQLAWGDKINVVYPDPAALDISRFGFYEEGLTQIILDNLKPGMTFLDIGAHIGYYTLMAAWLVGERGSVHSFEPTPETFKILESNAGDKLNVCLNSIALSHESGTIQLNDYGPQLMGRNSKFQVELNFNKNQNIEPIQHQVTATTVDQYVALNQLCPDFIKIDAEHSEYDIIRGMRCTLAKYRPSVSIEVGDMGVPGVPPCRELVELMTAQGYQAYQFDNNRIVEHSIQDLYQYDNILFKPKF